MERRVLIALFLAFIVLYVWQALFVKTPPPESSSPPPAAAAPSNAPVAPPTGANATTPVPSAPSENAAPRATALVGEQSERDVRVETRDVIAIFTNRGARLKSWRLKHFLDPSKQPQELVEHDLPTQPLPFTLRTGDDALTTTLNTALYAVGGGLGAPVESAPIDLRFEYRDSSGVRAVKEFHLEPASYIVTL